MGKRIEIYRVPVKEHERTYVRIIDEPEYEERQPPPLPERIFRARRGDYVSRIFRPTRGDYTDRTLRI